MIPVQRGAEPAKLLAERDKQLARLRAMPTPFDPREIKGYRIIVHELATRQNFKCCYCEAKLRDTFNPVDHFRPKGAANRMPGSNARHGYWWLAFTWENLLFCCPDCNSSGKKEHFPLANGSTALQAEQNPPGNEIVLLLDPCSGINPAEHIEYVHAIQGKTGYWYARPRNGSILGGHTIEVCNLNQQALLGSRNDHIACHVQRDINYLSLAINSGKKKAILKEFQRISALFAPKMPYSLFTYDVLRANFPDATLLAAINETWPNPAEIGK